MYDLRTTVKIRNVSANNHKKAFELRVGRKLLAFPYAKATPRPTTTDPVRTVVVDTDLACEAVSFELASGKCGTVHVEQVLEYHQHPTYLREELLYTLTLEAQRRLSESTLATREVIRRLRTSASQFYRLVDQTNYRKSVDQMLALLHALDCDVHVVVRTKKSA
jgi:hypothetical protein